MKKQGKSNKNRFTRQNSSVPILIIVAAVFIVVSILLYIALSGNQKITNQDTIPRVTVAESKRAFDQQEAVFLDVRVEDAYAVSHIPGAVSIPVAQLESQLDSLDPQAWIITYCT
ncbi:MAG: rhodanese-like domain-containing protein [Anaerolineaceae bacterium]